MLFTLKQKKKTNQLKNFPGAFAPAFNPLNVPSYRAGYLMNYDNDVPKGSINNLVISAQWFDAKVLNAGSKLLTRGNGTVTSLVNGFKCESINSSTARPQNTTIDIFNGVTNCTFVIGFNRAAVAAGHMIFAVRNTADTANFYLILRSTKKLELTFSQGATIATVTSALNYDDNAWHVAVCVIDQSNKTVTLYTDLGEVLTNTNALLGAPIALTYNNQTYCRVGAWWIASLTFNNGLIGDLIIFNTVLSLSSINAVLEWEKNRLGI